MNKAGSENGDGKRVESADAVVASISSMPFFQLINKKTKAIT
jgi:hypothetical protein